MSPYIARGRARVAREASALGRRSGSSAPPPTSHALVRGGAKEVVWSGWLAVFRGRMVATTMSLHVLARAAQPQPKVLRRLTQGSLVPR